MSVMIRKFTFMMLLVVALLTASGCGGSRDSGPELIGAYPSSGDYAESFAPLPKSTIIVYHAMIDLRVRSVSNAFEDVKDLSHEYAGYITTARIWYEDRDENATVVVSVPVYNFDLLYAEIQQLGVVESQSVTGELDPYPDYGHDEMVMSTITVHLSERTTMQLPAFPNWHAANTFQQAFRVVSIIFRFLLDAAIWIVVVLGPFALIGWVGRRLWLSRQTPQSEPEEEKA